MTGRAGHRGRAGVPPLPRGDRPGQCDHRGHAPGCAGPAPGSALGCLGLAGARAAGDPALDDLAHDRGNRRARRAPRHRAGASRGPHRPGLTSTLPGGSGREMVPPRRAIMRCAAGRGGLPLPLEPCRVRTLNRLMLGRPGSLGGHARGSKQPFFAFISADCAGSCFAATVHGDQRPRAEARVAHPRDDAAGRRGTCGTVEVPE